MTISTNQKPTIYRNLFENTGPDVYGPEMSQVNPRTERIESV